MLTDIFPDPKSSSPQSRIYDENPSEITRAHRWAMMRGRSKLTFFATTNCAWLRLKIRTSVHT